MTRARLAWAVLAAAVAGAALAGWWRPVPLEIHAAGARGGPWRLPDPARLERSSAADFAEVLQVAWVGTGGAVVTPGDTSWQLLGLVGRPDDRAILVSVANDPVIKRYGAGDTLPDGSRLVRVGSDGIVIDRQGCRVRRPLYAPPPENDPARAAEECLAPGTD